MALAEYSAVTSQRGLVAFAERDAHRTVVWLQGEHDVSTVAALSETMARAISLDDADLVIDLSGVDFIDAATVGVIVRARDFLRQRSRTLALRSPSSCARRILDVCDLSDLLDPSSVTGTGMNGRDMTGATGALGRLVPVPATDGTDAEPVAGGDLQQLARRGDAALLSLLRLGEHKRDNRLPTAKKTAARLMSRASRSTRFPRPS